VVVWGLVLALVPEVLTMIHGNWQPTFKHAGDLYDALSAPIVAGLCECHALCECDDDPPGFPCIACRREDVYVPRYGDVCDRCQLQIDLWNRDVEEEDE
jgi:hypothetical protein